MSDAVEMVPTGRRADSLCGCRPLGPISFGEGEAGGVGLLVGDQAGGELQQGEVVLVLLGPADQDPAVSVYPRVGGLDYPPAGAPAGSAGLFLDLLAACPDVRREVVAGDQLAGLLVVIGLVQTDVLRRLGRGLWPLDRDRVERRLQQLVVVAVGALVVEPDRDPRALRKDRSLRPFLALSVGFGPVFGPPRGAFDIAPSAASQDQSIPTCSS